MKDVFHLALRYLRFHPLKTGILVTAIALIVMIPAQLRVLVRQGQGQLTRRAGSTPLLLGAKGSPLELTLSSLYFSRDHPESITFADVAAIDRQRDVRAIPLYVRYRSRQHPIVGTSLDYFAFRQLEIAEGAMMRRIGDCVLGANVARRRGIVPNGHIVSSPESALGLADTYPLKMRVTGILKPAGSPDDDAVFVDIKTTWVIEGLGHGHDDLSRPGASEEILQRDGDRITANASVREYQEITDQNLRSFHFHGDLSGFPASAAVVLPSDHKSQTLTMGKYQDDSRLQLVRPSVIVDELLTTVFAVQNVVLLALAIVGAVALVLVIFVFALSLRQRAREIETMFKIGGSRSRVLGVLSVEIGTVLMSGLLIALLLTSMTQFAAPLIVRRFLMA